MTESKIDLKKVIRLRELGYTQKQIARRMNVTQQAISLVLIKTVEEIEKGVRA